MLAGLDLHTGRVIEEISNTHKSADFISFLRKLDGDYPPHQKIRLLLDHHSRVLIWTLCHNGLYSYSYPRTVPG